MPLLFTKPEFSSPFLLVFEEPKGGDPLDANGEKRSTQLSPQSNGTLSTADKTSWAQTENDPLQLSTYKKKMSDSVQLHWSKMQEFLNTGYSLHYKSLVTLRTHT